MRGNQFGKISEILQKWYVNNKRELPWRDTNDPYKIWVSEIILQQTRVNQGYGYYLRFVERFPNVEMLAAADEQEVLKFWQGLGYYSRARLLHRAAKKIMTDFGGTFPTEYPQILSLSGVGEYTAAAIASIAFGLPFAVVDGNVYRVLARLFANETPIDTTAGKRVFADLAQQLLDKNAPSTHNQAMMEFGAMLCKPASPHCDACPVQLHCEAFKQNSVAKLPVKIGKITVTNRYFHYFFIQNGGDTYLSKRTKKDIWQHLYEFPLLETAEQTDIAQLTATEAFQQLFSGCDFEIKKISRPFKHILSHRAIFAVFYTVNIREENAAIKQWVKIPLEEIDQYPVARLTELFLEGK